MNRNPTMMGFFPGRMTTTGSSVSSSQYRAAGFVPAESKTINKIRIWITYTSGTINIGDVTAELWSNTGSTGACVPNAAIETGKTPTAQITASGFYEFAGFTTPLTAGTKYYVVFKNSGTGVCSLLRINASAATTGGSIAITEGLPGSGSGWDSPNSTSVGPPIVWQVAIGYYGLRIGYSDSTYDGLPTGQANVNSADLVYGTREAGVVATTPPNAALKVKGVAMLFGASTGTPTGSPRFGLWQGSSPINLAYTPASSISIGTGLLWVPLYFAATQTIQPNTVLRVTLGESAQSDTSSNAYCLSETLYDSDSSSLAILPFGGSLRKTYFDGTNWTDNSPAGNLPQFALLLDPNGEFGAGGLSCSPLRSSIIQASP